MSRFAKAILVLFCLMPLSLSGIVLHKIYLQRTWMSHEPYIVWTVKPADTALINIKPGRMRQNDDGMLPMYYERAQYRFNIQNAVDGHYLIFVNDTLDYDLFVYRHLGLGQSIRPSSFWDVVPDTTYGYYLQEYPDGDLFVLYGKGGEIDYRYWGAKNVTFSPVAESFDLLNDLKIEELFIWSHGMHIAKRTFNVTANTFRWEIDTTYGYLVSDLRHPVCKPELTDWFKSQKTLNGRYTFILKEPVDEGDMRSYKYSGTALVVTFKNNHFVRWKMSRMLDGKRVEVGNYDPASKPIFSRDKAQEYLEKVLLKSK